MAASFLLRSSRSALKCGDLASGRLPATGATGWTAIPLISQSFGSVAMLFSSNVSNLALAKQREDLLVTDDIVNSEAKLKALFLKWLSYNDHHFDVEDERSFKTRFNIFKVRSCFVNEYNKRGYSSIIELNQFSDLTKEEERAFLPWMTYEKEANQVIASGIDA
ncbi:hypothetical protein MKW92_022580 [Papaver armeniacum]|nr:hypothetical protein MKW92_022580 [Papaver armeniacum]